MIRINLLGQARPRPRKWLWNPFARPSDSARRIAKVPNRRPPDFSMPDAQVPPTARRPSLRMLADEALRDDDGDRLGFKPFADAIAGIIDSPSTATPLVMAINAKWGAGKTTLGHMVRRRLETKSAAGWTLASRYMLVCSLDARRSSRPIDLARGRGRTSRE